MTVRKTRLITALSVAGVLLLTGCAGGEEVMETNSPVAPSPTASASPQEGSSGEISLDATETTLESSTVAPEWSRPFFDSLAIGPGWVYASDDRQVIASINSFEPAILKQYLEALKNEGWQESLPLEETDDSVIAAVINPETGESATVIGLLKAIPDANGVPADPASSVVYSKQE